MQLQKFPYTVLRAKRNKALFRLKYDTFLHGRYVADRYVIQTIRRPRSVCIIVYIYYVIGVVQLMTV